MSSFLEREQPTDCVLRRPIPSPIITGVKPCQWGALNPSDLPAETASVLFGVFPLDIRAWANAAALESAATRFSGVILTEPIFARSWLPLAGRLLAGASRHTPDERVQWSISTLFVLGLLWILAKLR